jgi:hypothetical protein
MRSGAVAVLLLLGLGCGGVIRPAEPPLVADAGRELKAGTRVRVHLSQLAGKVVGDLIRVSADTLVLAPEADRNGELTLSAADVRRVDFSRGERAEAPSSASLVASLAAMPHLC